MIPCFSKNDRANRLFAELTAIDPRYLDAGVRLPRRKALYLGALTSVCTDRAQFKTDRMFTPAIASDMEAQGSELMTHYPDARAMMYWGAMNSPVAEATRKLPYFIITDGRFDRMTLLIRSSGSRGAGMLLTSSGRVAPSATLRMSSPSASGRGERSLRFTASKEWQVTRIGWGPLVIEDKPAFGLLDSGYFLSVGNQWNCKGMDLVSKAGADFTSSTPTPKP